MKTRNKNEFITELCLSLSHRKIFCNIVLTHPMQQTFPSKGAYLLQNVSS